MKFRFSGKNVTDDIEVDVCLYHDSGGEDVCEECPFDNLMRGCEGRDIRRFERDTIFEYDSNHGKVIPYVKEDNSHE